jgi:hypothetical protein
MGRRLVGATLVLGTLMVFAVYHPPCRVSLALGFLLALVCGVLGLSCATILVAYMQHREAARGYTGRLMKVQPALSELEDLPLVFPINKQLVTKTAACCLPLRHV